MTTQLNRSQSTPTGTDNNGSRRRSSQSERRRRSSGRRLIAPTTTESRNDEEGGDDSYHSQSQRLSQQQHFNSSKVSLHRTPSAVGSKYQTTSIDKHYSLNNQIYDAFRFHYDVLFNTPKNSTKSGSDKKDATSSSSSSSSLISGAFYLGIQFVETALLEIPKHGYFYSNEIKKYVRLRRKSSKSALEVIELLETMLSKLLIEEELIPHVTSEDAVVVNENDNEEGKRGSQKKKKKKSLLSSISSQSLSLLLKDPNQWERKLHTLKGLAQEQCNDHFLDTSYESKRMKVEHEWYTDPSLKKDPQDHHSHYGSNYNDVISISQSTKDGLIKSVSSTVATPSKHKNKNNNNNNKNTYDTFMGATLLSCSDFFCPSALMSTSKMSMQQYPSSGNLTTIDDDFWSHSTNTHHNQHQYQQDLLSQHQRNSNSSHRPNYEQDGDGKDYTQPINMTRRRSSSSSYQYHPPLPPQTPYSKSSPSSSTSTSQSNSNSTTHTRTHTHTQQLYGSKPPLQSPSLIDGDDDSDDEEDDILIVTTGIQKLPPPSSSTRSTSTSSWDHATIKKDTTRRAPSSPSSAAATAAVTTQQRRQPSMGSTATDKPDLKKKQTNATAVVTSTSTTTTQQTKRRPSIGSTGSNKPDVKEKTNSLTRTTTLPSAAAAAATAATSTTATTTTQKRRQPSIGSTATDKPDLNNQSNDCTRSTTLPPTPTPTAPSLSPRRSSIGSPTITNKRTLPPRQKVVVGSLSPSSSSPSQPVSSSQAGLPVSSRRETTTSISKLRDPPPSTLSKTTKTTTVKKKTSSSSSSLPSTKKKNNNINTNSDNHNNNIMNIFKKKSITENLKGVVTAIGVSQPNKKAISKNLKGVVTAIGISPIKKKKKKKGTDVDKDLEQALYLSELEAVKALSMKEDYWSSDNGGDLLSGDESYFSGDDDHYYDSGASGASRGSNNNNRTKNIADYDLQRALYLSGLEVKTHTQNGGLVPWEEQQQYSNNSINYNYNDPYQNTNNTASFPPSTEPQPPDLISGDTNLNEVVSNNFPNFPISAATSSPPPRPPIPPSSSSSRPANPVATTFTEKHDYHTTPTNGNNNHNNSNNNRRRSSQPMFVSFDTLKLFYHEDFDSLLTSGRVTISEIPTYQGRIPNSTNGCTVIAPLICIHHFHNNDNGNGSKNNAAVEQQQQHGVVDDTILSNEMIVKVIDEITPKILPEIRTNLGLTKHAFLIPHDAHEALIEKPYNLMCREQFSTVCGGNILEDKHLGSFIKEISQNRGKKVGATFFLHQHVIAILQIRRPSSSSSSLKGDDNDTVWFDIIDSLPQSATLERMNGTNNNDDHDDNGSTTTNNSGRSHFENATEWIHNQWDELVQVQDSSIAAGGRNTRNDNSDSTNNDINNFNDSHPSSQSLYLSSFVQPNAVRIRCHDTVSLKATLQWYACSIFTTENANYIDTYQWDEKLTDFDPRVFQAFIWTEA